MSRQIKHSSRTQLHSSRVLAVNSQIKRIPTSERARGKRQRGGQANQRLPFVPPEDWHEPTGNPGRFRCVVQPAGQGFRHVVTPAEVRERLAELPREFTSSLEVVQFSRMTRKKRLFPCYGMQWGQAIYLYPIEASLQELYTRPPTPAQLIEARMYGGQWSETRDGSWQLAWTEAAVKDFYLNNILIHELGHLVDLRNDRSIDRERYAEWFAIHYGYLPTQRWRRQQRQAAQEQATSAS